MHPIHLKIAYIGGGSRLWARKLMVDIALCPDLKGEVALYDIDMESARLNEELGNWMQTQAGVVSRWRYFAVATLEEALRDADFVIISIQPGPLELMADEIGLVEQYGLFLPVGDTTGAPGLIRGLRSYLQCFCRSNRENLSGCLGDELHQPDERLHANSHSRGPRVEGLRLLS